MKTLLKRIKYKTATDILLIFANSWNIVTINREFIRLTILNINSEFQSYHTEKGNAVPLQQNSYLCK